MDNCSPLHILTMICVARAYRWIRLVLVLVPFTVSACSGPSGARPPRDVAPSVQSSGGGLQPRVDRNEGPAGTAPHGGHGVARHDLSPDLQVVQLNSTVWIHTSWSTISAGNRVSSNGIIVREGDHLLLIDTAWGEGLTEQLLGWIDTALALPVKYAIATHSHHDRIGGAGVLKRRNIPLYVHPVTQRLAAERGILLLDTLGGLRRPGSAVQLGTAEIFYPGPGHTVDNLMVWVPEHRVLVGGCAVRGATWNLGPVSEADTVQWPIGIERAQQRYARAQWVVPGHGDVAGPELLRHTRSLFRR